MLPYVHKYHALTFGKCTPGSLIPQISGVWSVSRLVGRSVGWSVSQSVGWSVSQPLGRSVGRSEIGRSVGRSEMGR